METVKLENKKIAIIGNGHMGSSLMKGLLNCGFKKKNIFLSNRSSDNKKAALRADWIILAVKPLIVQKVILEIKDFIKNKLLISVAVVVSVSTLMAYTRNKKQKIIRIMPNIPVAYNEGIIGIYLNKFVSRAEKDAVITMLSSLGKVLEVRNEQELDSLTLISACGPAIVSCFIAMLSKAAIKLGFSQKAAEIIALKTFTGTLAYLRGTGLTPKNLQQEVATKGGITEEIIKSMENNSLYSLFYASIKNGKIKMDNLRKKVQK
ncbi:NAD(P)-binding domain-containing protein [Patescibacteria group bacterium]|nr:NAD(P)-binding domain-containing protein [Patescibacteria group bacterium]MBU4016243.1 NAD(P)-binding domain-containing protein [Patescibacteria group bacterium]MBU4098428.1 NAD(P)-binding domain-containing protein [Patescibacteria group bacterium]